MNDRTIRNGLPLLPVRPGAAQVTSELVQQLREELPFDPPMATIRVELPAHLRALAKIAEHEVRVDVAGPATVRAALDALEARYPALLGTIRDHATGERRAFLRYFADMQDISHDSPDRALPAAVADGREPLIVLGAVAGGR